MAASDLVCALSPFLFRGASLEGDWGKRFGGTDLECGAGEGVEG